MSLFFWLLACSPTPSDTAVRTDSGEDTASEAGAWSWDGLSPQWTEEEVGAEIEAALSWGIPQAEVLCDNILTLLSRGDDVCPGHSSMISVPYVSLEGCTAETGYTYRGILVYEEDTEEEDGREKRSQYTSTADFEIIHPTGETFLGGGSVDYIRSKEIGEDEVDQGRAVIQGMWEDPLHEAPWLAQGISAYLSLFMEPSQEGSGNLAKIDGTLGIGGHYLFFDELEFRSNRCENGPSDGELWIRQPDSSWYQLLFDEKCGCPQVTWNETEPVGELCIDLSEIRESLVESLGGGF